MSIWRAPLLIVGIFIVLLAAAALAAPWFIDWNRYRPQLQAWGKALTGREVTIAGTIDFVLFPWPAARLHQVRVASAPGSRFDHLLTVEELEARFSLGALFGGRLEVESVRLRRPVLALEHLGDGKGNWQLSPQANLRLPLAPERIAMDSVQVEQGTLRLADDRLRRTLSITNIDAHIRAPRLTGPWRIKGSARLLARSWRLYATTGEIRSGAPISLSLRLEPPKNESGLLVRLDGMLAPATATASQPRFDGRLQLHPVVGDKRGDPLDPTRQLDVKAKVRVDPAAVELTELKVEPRFPARAPFDAISGRMRMEFGPALNTGLLLRTTRLRLDGAYDQRWGMYTPQGRRGLQGLRQRLRTLARALPALPPELLLQLDMQATTVEFNGRTYTNAALSAEVTREFFTIRHLRADAPHATRLSFRGTLRAGNDTQLSGKLTVSTTDVRSLLFGLSPEAQALLRGLWRGAPGSFELLATLDLTNTSLRLVSHKMSIDGAPASLDWRHTITRSNTSTEKSTNKIRNEIAFSAEKLDLDAWRGAASLAEVQPLLSPVDADFRLLANIGELRLAGLRWRNTHLDLLHTPRTIRFDTLRADLAGLSLQGDGAFHRAGWQDPWRGKLSVQLQGTDATVLWQAASGLADTAAPPDWLRRLGAMDITLKLEATPTDDAEKATEPPRIRTIVRLQGRAGPAEVDLDINGNARWPELAAGRWHIRATVNSPQATPVLALARLPAPAQDGPLHFTLQAQGTPEREMRTTTRLRWPGLQFRYTGSIRLPEEANAAFPWLQGEGKVSLNLADAAWALRLARLHAQPAIPVDGEATLAFSPAHLALRKLKARLGQSTIGGAMKLAWPLAEPPTIQARLATNRADLRALLRLLLAAPDNAVRLRQHIAAGWQPDVELRADTLRLSIEDWHLPAALMRITTADDDTLRLEVRGGKRDAFLKAQALLRRVPLGLHVRGDISTRLPLQHAVRIKDDTMRIKGQAHIALSYKGRTVTLPGFLPMLQGTGTLRFQDARIEGLSPDRLLHTLRRIEDEKAMKRFHALVRENLHAGTWPLPSDELKLSLANGMLELVAPAYDHTGVTTRLNGLMNPASRKIDVTLEFVEKRPQAAPAFSITLAGPPQALSVSRDLGAVREWLQERLIQRKLAEIRRLEEQRRRMEERARQLEEEERKRQEQISQQQAEDIVSRLEQTLSAIRPAELHRERETAANPAPPEDGTLRKPIRQAQEEDKPAIVTTPPARVAPGDEKTTPERPRRTPTALSTTDQRRKDTSRKTTNTKPIPEKKRNKLPRKKPATNATRTPSKAAPKKTTAKKPAHETQKPVPRQKRGPRVIYKPLTNWNNRSRAPATP